MRKAAVGALLAASTITGGAIGAALLSGGTASAQTSTDSSTSSSSAATPRDPKLGGHSANGITEALLTGDAATSATAAAQAAVPDGTIDRVENDAEGAVYEAHVTKADGSHVTVKMDASFNVTGVETGPGK